MNVVKGTSADDVITAEPGVSATTGLATTTINAGDSIDGSAGNDTLNITATAANNNSLTGLTVKGVEVVNITGANNLGGNSGAIADAAEDVADAAAALATKQAVEAVADGKESAAEALVEAFENSGATEDDVIALKSASSVSELKAQFLAAQYFDATYAGAGEDHEYADVEEVQELTSAEFGDLEITGFTQAQYVAAATASLTNIDGSVSTDGNDDGDVSARAEGLVAAKEVAYQIALASTKTDAQMVAAVDAYEDIIDIAEEDGIPALTLAAAIDTTLEADQVAAAYEYLEANNVTDVAELTAASTGELPAGVTTFTEAQYNAAAASALVDDDGADITEDVAEVAAVTESAVVTFADMSAGQSVTVAGTTLYTFIDLEDTEVAEIFALAAVGQTAADHDAEAETQGVVAAADIVISGTHAGWDVEGEAGATVTFDSETAATNVTDITTSSVGGYEVSAVTTDGSAQVVGVSGDTNVDARLTVLLDASATNATLVGGSLAAGRYTAADLREALTLAISDENTGDALSAADVETRAGTLEALYQNAEDFSAVGDYTFAEIKAAATAATVSAAGVSLITAADNSGAIDARNNALEDAAETVYDAAVTATAAAQAVLDTATNTAAVLTPSAGTVSAAQFAGSEEIWLKGASNLVNVTGATTQTIGLDSLSGMDNSIAFGAAAGSVYLKGATGELTVTGAKALSLSGTTSTLTLTAAASTSLDVDMSGANTLTLTAADALESITISGAGKSTLKGVSATVESITSAGAAVTATISTETVIDVEATDLDETVNATVTTGAGADTITVATTGTGKTTVSTGDGGDVIVIGSRGLNTRDSIDAGNGIDTVVFAGKTYAAQDYVVLDTVVSGVEVALYYSSVTADASKLGLPVLALESGGTLTEASGVSITTWGSLTASSTGYEETDGDVDTVYGGSLAITLSGGTSVLTTKKTGSSSALDLNAKSATVTIAATSNGSITGTSIKGDLETLVVNMANSKTTTADALAATTITVTATENQALTSVDLNGTGSVTIDTSAAGEDEIVLATIDASGLGGKTLYTNGKANTTVGSITGGLDFTGNSHIAENIILGSGTDSVTVNSTYENMDTISGADFVKETSTAKSTTDTIIFGGLTLDGSAEDEITELELTSGATSLNLAFIEAAASGTDTVFFAFDGDTYLFKDGGNGTLDDADLAVKIVGIIDLTTDWGVYSA